MITYEKQKKLYKFWKQWLIDNVDLAVLTKMVVERGVPPQDSIQAMQQIYQASVTFVDTYEAFSTMIREMDDMGFYLIAREAN